MNELNSERLTLIQSNLAELRAWEFENLPFFGTVTGSYLYHKIAERSLAQREPINRSLKDLHYSSSVSERAIRLKLREFERDGLIESKSSEEDGRVRYLIPTEKFYEMVYQHSCEFDRIFSKNMVLIEKNA